MRTSEFVRKTFARGCGEPLGRVPVESLPRGPVEADGLTAGPRVWDTRPRRDDNAPYVRSMPEKSSAAEARLAALLDQVDRSELSSIRTVVAHILQIVSDPKSSVKRLKEAIEVDPPLCAKVLRRANSAYFGLRQRVSDILQAIIWLGFNAVRELALSQKVLEVFERGGAEGGYSRLALWRHSVAVALCAKLICRREFGDFGDAQYAAGLLHDLGMLAEVEFLEADFAGLVSRASQEKRDLAEMEREVFGFDHADTGGALMARWAMPKALVEGIRYHHAPSEAPASERRMADLLSAASWACHRHEMGCGEVHPDTHDVAPVLGRLGVSAKALDFIMESVNEDIARMEEEGWFEHGG